MRMTFFIDSYTIYLCATECHTFDQHCYLNTRVIVNKMKARFSHNEICSWPKIAVIQNTLLLSCSSYNLTFVGWFNILLCFFVYLASIILASTNPVKNLLPTLLLLLFNVFNREVYLGAACDRQTVYSVYRFKYKRHWKKNSHSSVDQLAWNSKYIFFCLKFTLNFTPSWSHYQ